MLLIYDIHTFGPQMPLKSNIYLETLIFFDVFLSINLFSTVRVFVVFISPHHSAW